EADAGSQLREVSAGFAGDDVAGLEDPLAVAVDVWRLVRAETDAVAAVVDQAALLQPRMLANLAVDEVSELRAPPARSDEARDFGMNRDEEIVDLLLERRGLGHGEGPTGVGVVVLVGRLGVDDVELAGFDLSVARRVAELAVAVVIAVPD